MKRHERVSAIMSRDPLAVHVDQTILEVQALMTENRFHHVPVVSGRKLIGMISSTDLMRASFEYGADGRHTQVLIDRTRTIADLMQRGPVTIRDTDTVRHATELLAQNWFHSLPVVDERDTLVGIVTTTDILNYLLDQY